MVPNFDVPIVRPSRTHGSSQTELPRLLRSVDEPPSWPPSNAPDAARYEMNGFIIAAGSYVKSLSELAIQYGEKIGPVTADLGNNECQIPFAPAYIRKVQKRGAIGEKRKTVKC